MMSAVHCHRVSRQNFRVVTCERARAGFGAAFTVLRFLISAGAADIEELPIFQYCHKKTRRCFADHMPAGLLVDKKVGLIGRQEKILAKAVRPRAITLHSGDRLRMSLTQAYSHIDQLRTDNASPRNGI